MSAPQRAPRHLIGQGETAADALGRTFGYSLYALGDQHFSVVMHGRTYEKSRMTSKWDSDPVAFEADTEHQARAEATRRWREFAETITAAHPIPTEEVQA